MASKPAVSRWPAECEVHLLTAQQYKAAMQQLADWWGWAGITTRSAWEVAFLRIKKPSRSYVRILQDQGPVVLTRHQRQAPGTIRVLSGIIRMAGR